MAPSHEQRQIQYATMRKQPRQHEDGLAFEQRAHQRGGVAIGGDPRRKINGHVIPAASGNRASGSNAQARRKFRGLRRQRV